MSAERYDIMDFFETLCKSPDPYVKALEINDIAAQKLLSKVAFFSTLICNLTMNGSQKETLDTFFHLMHQHEEKSFVL